jgi:hypothetical protein
VPGLSKVTPFFFISSSDSRVGQLNATHFRPAQHPKISSIA